MDCQSHFLKGISNKEKYSMKLHDLKKYVQKLGDSTMYFRLNYGSRQNHIEFNGFHRIP